MRAHRLHLTEDCKNCTTRWTDPYNSGLKSWATCCFGQHVACLFTLPSLSQQSVEAPSISPDCAITGIWDAIREGPQKNGKRANLTVNFYKAAGLTQALYFNDHTRAQNYILLCSVLPPTREILDVTKTVHNDDRDLSVPAYYMGNSELATTTLRSQPDPCMATSTLPAWKKFRLIWAP